MFSSNRIGLRKMYAENALYRKDWKHFLPTLFVRSTSCFKEDVRKKIPIFLEENRYLQHASDSA